MALWHCWEAGASSQTDTPQLGRMNMCLMQVQHVA
jgi:hypothetical protein